MRLDSGGMAPGQVKEDVEFLLSRCAL
jgi:hypothetical protein